MGGHNAVAKLAEDLRLRTMPGGKGQVYDQFDNGRMEKLH